MSQIKEAIELLEEIKTASGKRQCDVFYYLKADQAIAKLTEQPQAGEFTKRAREINNTENVPKWLVRRTLGEACDLIDCSEARYEDVTGGMMKKQVELIQEIAKAKE